MAVFESNHKCMELSSTVSGPAKAMLFLDSRCGECEESIATWECEECSENYCEDCRELVHSKGRRKQHTTFSQIRICVQCQNAAAKMECLDCDAVYCTNCCNQVHAPGSLLSSHKYLKQLNTAGFKIVDLSVNNGFAIPVKDLVLSRFPDAPFLENTIIFTEEIAKWCRDNHKHFFDPEPITLALPSTVERVSSVSLSMRLPPEFIMKMKQKEKEVDERNKKRAEELAPILKMIQLWRRLPKMVAYPTLFEEGNTLLKSKPQGTHCFRNAVHTLPKFERGLFKDTWYQLAVGMIATNREAFSNVFVTVEHKDVSMYTFQFYQTPNTFGENQGWRCVTIDDLVPCAPSVLSSDGRVEFWVDEETEDADWNTKQLLPVFGLTDQRSELWNILMQKAYAKFLGSYSLLHRGDTTTALTHLTGGDCLVEHWDPKKVSPDTVGLLWWRIKQGIKLGLLLACVNAPDEENTALDTDGLVTRHAESFMEWVDGEAIVSTTELTPQQLHEMQVKSDKAQKGANLIMLRNTQGYQEWTGDWSHTSHLWKTAVREYVNYKTMDEYMYWISVTDYVMRYNTLLQCTNFEGGPLVAYTTQVGCPVNETRLRAEQYLLTIDDLESDHHNILIVISQPDRKDFTFDHNYSDGADRAAELELILYRRQSEGLVEPIKITEELGASDRWDTSHVQGYVDKYEWPEGGIPLTEMEGKSAYMLKKSVQLPSGHYVLCVGKGLLDAKADVIMFVSFFNAEDEDGPTSSPYTTPAKRDRTTKPRSPSSLNNTKITMQSLGSWKAPKVTTKRPRPKTPREKVYSRIKQAKDGSVICETERC